MKATLIGLGIAAAIMLMLYPEIKSMREDPAARAERRSFEQQARAAQDVTATDEEDEAPPPRQTQQKKRKHGPIMYRDPRYGLRQLSPREIEARDRDNGAVSDEEDERISSEKNYQPADHWKWKYEAEENVICEPLWDMPWQIVCHTIFERPMDMEPAPPPQPPLQRYVEGQPIFGPDGQPHRTRRVLDRGCPNRGGCDYGG